jgi:hypothetical protein
MRNGEMKMTATTFKGQGIKHIKIIAEMFRKNATLDVDTINDALTAKYATKFVNTMRKELGFEIEATKVGRKIVSYTMTKDSDVDLNQWDKPDKVKKVVAAVVTAATASVAASVEDDEDDTPVMDMTSLGVPDSSEVVMQAHAVESDWDAVEDVRDLLR